MQNEILEYLMTEEDKMLANTALEVIKEYNGAYKPHLFNEDCLINPSMHFEIKHTTRGFSLIQYEKPWYSGTATKTVLITELRMSDFIEYAFIIIAHNNSVKWEDIVISKPVCRLLHNTMIQIAS